MGRWIGIGLAVITVLVVGFIVAAAIFPGFRETSRDIAIIILAVFQMIGAILTIALLLAILYAVQAINRLAQDTVIPKIDTLTSKLDQVIESTKAITGNVQDTASAVSTTTVYVAEQVVSPVIRASGALAGVKAAARYLAQRGEK